MNKKVEVTPMTAPFQSLNIYQRLLSISAAIGKLEKAGRNDFAKYNYVTEADVMAALKSACVEVGVVIIPTMEGCERVLERHGDKSREVMNIKMKFTLVNSDNPEEKIESVIFGCAHDSGDKSIWKAITGCYKYFAMKLFMLSTGDDPENDKGEVQPSSYTLSPGAPVGVMRNGAPIPVSGDPVSASAYRSVGVAPADAVRAPIAQPKREQSLALESAGGEGEYIYGSEPDKKRYFSEKIGDKLKASGARYHKEYQGVAHAWVSGRRLENLEDFLIKASRMQAQQEEVNTTGSNQFGFSHVPIDEDEVNF